MFVFRKKNKDGKKIDQLLSLLEKDPENTKNRLRLADFYLRTGDKKSAIREYQTAAKYLSGEGFNLKAISVYKKIFRSICYIANSKKSKLWQYWADSRLYLLFTLPDWFPFFEKG